MSWITVAAIAELPPGQYRVVDVDGARIAVFNVDGEFHAVEDVCSHDGASLTGLPLDGDQIICPRHGARFCVRTGEALTAPAYEPIERFPVRVENGVVQVRDHRWD
jgi:3-phenylpropionate/trans-cinnamate dioxygenase ferredoxin subunit